MNAYSGKPAFNVLAVALLAAFSSGSAWASEASEASGLADLMAGKGDAQPLKDYGIKWGGWLNSSVTYNGNNTPDKFNGPVTFGDRAEELQVNQVYWWLQKGGGL